MSPQIRPRLRSPGTRAKKLRDTNEHVAEH